MYDFHSINRQVMIDTKHHYETNPELQKAVSDSISRQFMITHDEDISQPQVAESHTEYVCSGKRSFEAAKAYRGKKVAVLNYANNHSIGGAPFSAGAQEESLCRCSTLLPCLEAMRAPFYSRHRRQYEAGEIGAMGNDDLIYTPDVVVFKTDERSMPIKPEMMPQEEWYKVDVITCAAPQMNHIHHKPSNYEEIITSRVKKILDVAAREKAEVLILGAWGCGAFHNDPYVVSRAFHTLLPRYDFQVVEFALATNDDVSHSVFAKHG